MDADAVTSRLEAARGARWVDEQVVEPGEARRYASLHGYEEELLDVAPPGYGAALVMRAVLKVLHDDRLALPFDRNVHAAQSLTWSAPLPLGARLVTEARVQRVRHRERAVFFEVETVSTDATGTPCMTGISTHAVRHG